MALAEKVMAFTPVMIRRADPIHDRHSFDQSEIQSVMPQAETAPQPVQQSAFYGVGRDATHAPTPIRTYSAPAPAEWLSVMGWPFGVKRTITQQRLSMPRGRANVIRSRIDIDNPPNTPLGQMATLGGAQTFDANLAKITF